MNGLTREQLGSVLGFDLPPHRLPYEQMRLDFGVGMIGLHWVTQIMQLPAYRAARYRLVAACDIDRGKIDQTLTKGDGFGQVTEDWRELMANDAVDVIDCSFGHRPGKQERRLEVVEAAAKAGKHLMIHKPVAWSLGFAKKLAEAARQGGIWLAVNQNCRYNPANYTVKQLLRDSRMGQPRIIELQSYWRGGLHDDIADRPGTISHTIHHADLLRWWVDRRCVSVYAKANRASTMAIYEFEDGATVYHMENHSGEKHHQVHARIMTERGLIHSGHNWNWHIPSSAEYDYVTVTRDTRAGGIRLPLPEHIYEPDWSLINHYIPHEGPYYDLAAPIAGMMGTMGSLMDGVARNEAPDNHIDHSIASFRIAMAAQISARTGKPVDPADVDDDVEAVC